MGGALIMEGFLSACYHVCPTVESFQFDTTFMYIMAVLVFLKVYQFRHPDVTSNAYIVFAFIALGLMFEVIGYYSHNWIFWTIFVQPTKYKCEKGGQLFPRRLQAAEPNRPGGDKGGG